ncbi:MAG: DUF4340 domain-containing protein [Oscillospiraceae bacterium]|nr:DUF4340 domain-containing protein [Oscillospiraceae bacterium]
MSDTPDKNLNTPESNGQNNSLENENLDFPIKDDTIQQTNDLNKEASDVSKPPKAPYIDEESTIFTATKNYDNKKVVIDSGKKRIGRIVVSVVVVLALLGSIFAITSLIPTDKETSSDTSSSSIFSIPVIATDSENVESVSVKNSVDSFDLYFETVESASSDTASTSSESTSSKAWYVSGIDKSLTSSSIVSSYIDSCTSLTAFKLMEDQSLDYGFDTPSTVITVKCNSNYSYTITVGDVTPDKSGNYVRVDVISDSNVDVNSEISTTVPGNGNVYIVTTENLSSFEVETTNFANLQIVDAIAQTDANSSYFTDSKLATFDYITLSGTNYDSEIRIEPNSDAASSYIAFKVTKPAVRYADAEKLTDYITLFSSGLSASAVISYSQTDENLALYGFSNPLAVITMKVGDKIEKLTIGSEKDSTYYVIVDGKSPVYMVATSSMAYASLPLTDYYSQFLLLDNINTISSIQFVSDGQDIKFDLAFSNDEDDTDVLTATYDGTTVDSDSMKNLYQSVLMLEPQEYLNTGVEGTNVLTITIKYNNGNSNKIIRLTTYEDSSRRYMATVNGAVQGLISKSSVTSIISNVKEVALG